MRIQLRRNRVAAWIVVVVLGFGLNVGTGRAELGVGDTLPEFTLPATDSSAMVLSYLNGTISLKHGITDAKPPAVVLHFFQPDCLQCRAQLKELQAISVRFLPRGVIVVGIAHRGDARELAQFGKDLGVSFPLLLGTGSDIAKKLAAGDSLGIADKTGRIHFAQVGYGKGDEALWADALEELLAGKSVSKTSVDRDRLAVGDPFPAVELPSIAADQLMALVGKQGRLIFRDGKGKETHPKAAVGFFSRY